MFAQSEYKRYDSIGRIADSIQNTIIFKVDTIVKYIVYGLHGDSIQHSFPMRLCFDKSKKIVSATDLRVRTDGELTYWFNNRKFIVKRTRKQLAGDEFQISSTIYMNRIDEALVEAVLLIAKYEENFL